MIVVVMLMMVMVVMMIVIDDLGNENDGDVVMMLMMATTSPFLFLHRCQQQAAKVAEGSVSRLFARWMISIVVAASSLSS